MFYIGGKDGGDDEPPVLDAAGVGGGLGMVGPDGKALPAWAASAYRPGKGPRVAVRGDLGAAGEEEEDDDEYVMAKPARSGAGFSLGAGSGADKHAGLKARRAVAGRSPPVVWVLKKP